MPGTAWDAVVSTTWLANHLSAPDIRIVDATYFLPNVGRDARAEYREAHIPGAQFFDIDEIKDDTNPLPHMLPPPEKFTSRVRKMGLGDGNRIVVYDRNMMMSAARVWWMFRFFGHNDVAVLDGGLVKWQAEGRPVDDMPPVPRDRHFTPRINNLLLRDGARVAANIESRREQLVDARSPGRFAGTEDEPRPGLRGGHIPGSLNLHYQALLDPASGTILKPDAIRDVFSRAGVDLSRPIIATCGSGVTACVIALAAFLVGRTDVAIYDGSWSEWGLPGGRPIASGAAERAA